MTQNGAARNMPKVHPILSPGSSAPPPGRHPDHLLQQLASAGADAS